MIILSPEKIGHPHWERVPVGDITTTWTQYLSFSTTPNEWRPVPWFSDEGHQFPCRLIHHYRRPVTWQGKLQAIWMARNKLFKRYILRKKS